jgi:hypothetical protein
MAQRWYIGNWKSAERVDRPKGGLEMLDSAGGILLAFVMVLFSFLSYWVVWSLNGLGKEPRIEEIPKAGEKGRTGRPRLGQRRKREY